MPLALQLAHQRVDEGVAPAHQHHEVAGMQQLAAAARRSSPIRLSGMDGRSAAPAARAAHRRRVARRAATGRSCRPRSARRATSGQSSTVPGLAVAAGDDARHRRRRPGRALRFGSREHPVDGVEHRRGRAEGDGEVDLTQNALERRDACARTRLAHLVELARIGALEAEDRLLGVADREDRAVALDRAPRRRRTPRSSAARSPPIGRDWCPAPRRPGRGRCRRRACRAPRRRSRRSPAGRRVATIRSS